TTIIPLCVSWFPPLNFVVVNNARYSFCFLLFRVGSEKIFIKHLSVIDIITWMILSCWLTKTARTSGVIGLYYSTAIATAA
ncbi:hypothetical protein ACJX0J_039769, partial [Zea mays]